MALKWTNTSPPSSCWMNPYPLSALNHLTVPVATAAIPLLALDLHSGTAQPCGDAVQKRIPRAGSYQSGPAVSLGVFAMDPGALGRVLNRPSEALQTLAKGIGAGEVARLAGLVASRHE